MEKYQIDVEMRFSSVGDASDLRKAAEGALAGGLTTVGDRYSISVVDEAGECDLGATLRFADAKARDAVTAAAKRAKLKVKAGSVGHLGTHTCKHDRANIGTAACVDLVVESWGDIR